MSFWFNPVKNGLEETRESLLETAREMIRAEASALLSSSVDGYVPYLLLMLRNRANDNSWTRVVVPAFAAGAFSKTLRVLLIKEQEIDAVVSMQQTVQVGTEFEMSNVDGIVLPSNEEYKFKVDSDNSPGIVIVSDDGKAKRTICEVWGVCKPLDGGYAVGKLIQKVDTSLPGNVVKGAFVNLFQERLQAQAAEKGGTDA